MKKIVLTKKGKIISIIFIIILILCASGIVIYNKNNNEVEVLLLETKLLSEGDKIDKAKDSLILHVGSKAKLMYTPYPNVENLDITLNSYDKDILNIDSLGNITALKTGKTELKVYHENIVSNTITVYVY